MSSISGVTSATQSYRPATQNNFGRLAQDFTAIGGALQSGNVLSARGALVSFQKDLTGVASAANNQPFGKNSQANTDFQSLTAALQSGDLTGARQAYASLQTDLKGSAQTAQHHSALPAAGGGLNVTA
jgi:hypothetical protein